jgi:hypothetical protein
MRGGSMMRKSLVTAALFLILEVGFHPCSLQAQETTKALSLVYSNNLNGEIDSCPT